MLKNLHNERDYMYSSCEEERGGEAPMEIDSPPPLWLLNSKNIDEPTSCPNWFPLDTTASTPKTMLNGDSSPLPATPTTSNYGSPCIQIANHTPSKIKNTTPSNMSVKSSSPLASATSRRVAENIHTQSSPLRSAVHNYGRDTILHLRGLNNSHSPINPSPTSSYISMGMGHSPFSAASFVPLIRRTPPVVRVASGTGSVKKSRNPKDPTRAAAAAALHTSSSTSWHLHFPIILMNYFQLFFNTIIGLGLLYLMIMATKTVIHDAQLKVDERLQVMMSEISHCSRQYVDNRCSPDMRVPAMEKSCMEWEACMSRDPAATSRSRLFAETIAEILNGFFGAISTKTYVCMILGAVLIVVFFNAAFYFGRQAINGAGSSGFYRPGPSHVVDSLLSSHFGTPNSTRTGALINAEGKILQNKYKK